MQQVNSGIAYLFWCLCFFGVCGGQRFYTGQVGGGLIYLFTFGLFGIGQLIDLALVPDMVEKRNIYLRGLHGSANPSVNQSITLNIGDIPQLKQLQEAIQPAASSPISPMQKLLKAAKEHNGTLSIAQAAMYTELEPEQLKELLQEATRMGYAEINNDLNTGAIRYHFDI
ncbi:MAG: TM2 domain-containing protein [Desmonostoc vinosum HA7617-LM4]|jgi:TM2 domain-containing membrane protein YozV|nr:TM2 domain-containing protein [Desmonostoc vinosum HA7617-LM4]